MTKYRTARRALAVFTILCIATFLYIWRNEPRDLLSPVSDYPRTIWLMTDPQDPRLQMSAQNRADCISLELCPWSHRGYTEFIGNQLHYRTAGEVLGRDFDSWDEVIKAWSRSASHSAVIKGKWCEYGLASSSAGTETVYVGHFACE